MTPTTIKFLVMLAFIVADIVTGVAKAISTEGLNSKAMKHGLWNKTYEVLAAGFFKLVDFALPYVDIQLGFQLFSGAVIFICWMEIISCCENLIVVCPALEPILGRLIMTAKAQNNEKGEG